MAISIPGPETSEVNYEDEIEDHFTVCVGASAGGLEAIHELFDNMPKDTGFSFVIIQHLSPDYKSLIAELLEKHTQMKVSEASDSVMVQPNHIYVIPNNKNITIKNGKLCLKDKIRTKVPNMAIDIFLKSLAQSKKEKSIAIILSGTGTDGTKGALAIKTFGGLVFVQDPLTAQFDGMLNSVIASGNTDYILSPSSIPEELLASYKRERLGIIIKESLSADEEEILLDILALIRKITFCDFSNYKRPTIIRRLTRRLGLINSPSLKAYQELLNLDPEEVKNLSKEFLIGVTHFFRDKEAFETLKGTVIPDIVKRKSVSDSIKIWVAGCSTGEEAYSIAILFKDHFEKIKEYYEIKIFASDIDKDSLEIAQKGNYSENSLTHLSNQTLSRHFIKEGSKYKVHPDLRKMIIFSHHDLIKDAPFSKLDLISCRNMLIYFGPVLQKRCLSIFHFGLNLKGYLFQGPSESIGDLKDSFAEIDKKWKIYQNIFPSKGLRLDNISLTGSASTALIKTGKPGTTIHNEYSKTLIETLLSENNSAGIFIDENLILLETFGNYKNYIEFPDNKFDLNFLKLIPKDLSVILGSNIRKASRENSQIVLTRLKLIRKNGDSIYVNVTISALSPEKVQPKTLLILLQEDSLAITAKNHTIISSKDLSDADKYFALEQESRETKSILLRTIEDFETAGEELQSSNEELVSALEELQSTNEELQSLNEELHTVNAEHQLKIKEISELNDDLNNYLRSTEIGQVFVDKNLIIRKFTPPATSLINLIESDIGRPITNLSTHIENEVWEKTANVINTSEPFSKILKIENGQKWYQMKIIPYLRNGKIVDGAILTFVDITDIQKLSNDLEREREYLKAVLESVSDGIVACDDKGHITLFNKATRKFHGLPEKYIPAEEWSEHYSLHNPDGSKMDTDDIPLFKAFKGDKVINHEMIIAPKNGEKKLLMTNGQTILSAEGRNVSLRAIHMILGRAA